LRIHQQEPSPLPEPVEFVLHREPNERIDLVDSDVKRKRQSLLEAKKKKKKHYRVHNQL
jgi:hypothetical protein